MIRQLKLLQWDGLDPYENLAVEQHLMETVEQDACILYLWQNRSTVVIGRNQNAWKECCTTQLEEDGGHLARRLSGGGAVFHDLGNLNFTFLVHTENYDLRRQTEVILRACRALGIPAERSGRNDLLADGRKFSGNAFYQHHGRSYHHGTLLLDVDTERMSRYLRPSEAKLSAKGVDSVRSRVVNLRELLPGLTIEELRTQLAAAFGEVYGLPVEPMTADALDRAAVETIAQHNRQWEWNYGVRLPCTLSCGQKFDWGEVQLELQVESGIVRRVEVFSDAMDWSFPEQVKTALTGSRFTLPELCRRIRALDVPQAEELCRLLEQQKI